MEKLQYGNWIRRKILWSLGLASLGLGILAVLPLPAIVRVMCRSRWDRDIRQLSFPTLLLFIFSQQGGNMQEKFFDLILEHVEKNINGTLLDIGTGNGILWAIKAALSNPAAKVTGVDMWGKDWEYSKKVCEQNAQGAARRSTRVQFKKGDAASLNFADGTFDVVVSNLTFHEVKLVKRKSDVMREALRLLKPGGSFAFIDYFYDDRYYGDPVGFELLLRI